jgi:hypothetical protein
MARSRRDATRKEISLRFFFPYLLQHRLQPSKLSSCVRSRKFCWGRQRFSYTCDEHRGIRGEAQASGWDAAEAGRDPRATATYSTDQVESKKKTPGKAASDQDWHTKSRLVKICRISPSGNLIQGLHCTPEPAGAVDPAKPFAISWGYMSPIYSGIFRKKMVK